MSAPSHDHQHPAGEHHPHDGQKFTEQLKRENAVLGHGQWVWPDFAVGAKSEALTHLYSHTKAEQDAEQAEAAERREAIKRETAEKAHDSALHPKDRLHEHEHVHQEHK